MLDIAVDKYLTLLTVTFFIFFLGAQCFGKKLVGENKTLSCFEEDEISKQKALLQTFCPFFKEECSINILEEYEERADMYQHFWERSRYPILYTLDLFSVTVCPVQNLVPYPGFIDAISRLPPPGGTTSLDIFRMVLITSFHLSSRFMKGIQNFSSPSLRVDIIFDADYESVFGESMVKFRDYLLWHLKQIFRRSQSDVHTLTIKKGSIGITFFINLMNCVHSKYLVEGHPLSWIKDFNEQKKKMDPVFRNTEVNSIETDFSGFERNLNYQSGVNYFYWFRRVPYSVKTNIVYDSELWSKKLKLLGSNVNNVPVYHNFRKVETAFTSNYDKEQNQEKYPKKFAVNYGKLAYEKHEPCNSLPRNRIRRYVAREDETIMKLKVGLKFLKPIKISNQDEIHKSLVSQLAREIRVPVPSIKDMSISSETDVSFTLTAFNDDNNVMDDLSVIEAAETLKIKIKSQKLRLKDLNGQFLMTSSASYATVSDSSSYSLAIIVILSVTMLVLIILIITTTYIAKRTSKIPRSLKNRHKTYRNFTFGRDSSQSVGKYSYDSGLWIGPGPEPNFTVPDAPLYRPPTADQIASTPRPVTAVRTRLKKNWNIDERALSTIPDDFGRPYMKYDTPSA